MKNEFFDSYFESYFKDVNDLSEKGFEKSAGYYKSFYGRILPEDKNIKILDMGCGTGQFLYFLEKSGYKNYYGIDISKQQINFCKEKVTDKAEVYDAFEFLKYKKEVFNMVVANDIMEHIPKGKLKEILNLIRDSLTAEGVLLIKVPNMSNPFGLMDRYADMTHEVGFTEFSLSAVLKTVGFKSVKISGASYPVSTIKAVFAKGAEEVIYKILKIFFLVQGYTVPHFMQKNLIAIVKK